MHRIFDSYNQEGSEEAIAKYLQVSKRYDRTQTADFFVNNYRTFEGGPVTSGDQAVPVTDPNNARTFGYKYLLVDGTAINIFNTGQCTPDPTSVCASVQVDLNGIKPPNKTGRDFFHFAIMGNGTIYPAGGNRFGTNMSWKGTMVYNCTNPLQGDGPEYAAGCAGRIMDEGWQMNY